MQNGKASLPLAFVLAAAATSGAVAIPDAQAPLSAASLRTLLEHANGSSAPVVSDQKTQAQPARTAQWQNFFNCFKGSWRRC